MEHTVVHFRRMFKNLWTTCTQLGISANIGGSKDYPVSGDEKKKIEWKIEKHSFPKSVSITTPPNKKEKKEHDAKIIQTSWKGEAVVAA